MNDQEKNGQEQEAAEQHSNKRSEDNYDNPSDDRPEDISGDRLVEFVQKWATRLAPEKDDPEPQPQDPGGRISIRLLFLKALPTLTVITFGVSIFYDLSGHVHFPWRTDPVSLEGLIRTLSVTGLIGFLTNWVAIKMLFHPRQKRPILGQGLIPSRKEKIAHRLGQSISREIINSELILKQLRASGIIEKQRKQLAQSLKQVFNHPEFRTDIKSITEHYIQGFLKSSNFQDRIKEFVRSIDFENSTGIEGGLLKIYRFISGDKDISNKLEDMLSSITFRMDPYEARLAEFLDELPDMIENESEVIEEYALTAIIFLIEQVNVQKVVTDNLNSLDESRLEKLLMGSTSDQLQYIQYLGCFFGIIGGSFIWQPVESTVAILLITGSIFGLDYFIGNLQK